MKKVEYERSLLARRPDLAKQWDYKRNKPLKPEDVTTGSEKKVWWLCKRGHSWDASIYNRVRNGSNCPYCSGRRPILGETDLCTRLPRLAKEFDYSKNKPFKPEDFTGYSDKKVWWLCKRGHSWSAAIINRAKGSGCPYCSGRRPVLGVTDFKTLQPEASKEWDYQKNEGLKPEDYTEFSGKKVWWKCKIGHTWFEAIACRANRIECPFCQKRKKWVA